jgi:hypothetical protein
VVVSACAGCITMQQPQWCDFLAAQFALSLGHENSNYLVGHASSNIGLDRNTSLNESKVAPG